jgi:peroxiredoxin
MDNVNVIRVGFFAPQLLLTDTEMQSDGPAERSEGVYTCLVFVNPDDAGAEVISTLEQGIPEKSGGINWRLVAVVPLKPAAALAFKKTQKLQCRIFSDGESKAGKSYCINDSQSARPAYHPTIFVIGDEGTVRFRFNIENSKFDLEKFLNSITAII